MGLGTPYSQLSLTNDRVAPLLQVNPEMNAFLRRHDGYTAKGLGEVLRTIHDDRRQQGTRSSVLLEFMRVLVIAVLLAMAFVSGCASPSGASRHAAAVRRELLAMCDVDQKVRENFGSHMSAEAVAKMQAVDVRHTSRMRAIIAKHGWPGR